MNTVAQVLVENLLAQGKTISFAESCTGGMISETLVNIPGASEVFGYGFVTYSNEAKTRLIGVSENVLLTHGAVSEETAVLMAKGAREVSGAEIAISATGIAGPGGGTPLKPVGLVYIGVATCKKAEAFRFIFSGDRREVREQTVQKALQIAIDKLC